MLTIPHFMDQDDYLQNPVMKHFLRQHGQNVIENRADLIHAIEEFANSSPANEAETREWLLVVAKEGSKDFCYVKIENFLDAYKDPTFLRRTLEDLYPNCPMKNILEYRSTPNREMINYEIHLDENGEENRITFTFSELFLIGERGHEVGESVWPVFVDVYLDEGFIVSRAKAKTTLYSCTESRIISTDTHIDSLDYAHGRIQDIITAFGWAVEGNKIILKHEMAKMMYNMYKEFSFTPPEVEEQVNSVSNISNEYIDNIFAALSLSVRNKGKAREDLAIFVEKFISINGNNEEMFREDREAYLVKVGADDEQDMTKIDTSSNREKPLQCTEAFFDSKKSVIKSESCSKLNLCFKRIDPRYFGNKPIFVQFVIKKTYGVFKITQYAEEADINNVLQTVFRNYE